MRVLHAEGLPGARRARGVVVVVDVFRAFTVSAYALAAGAREVVYVADLAQAMKVAAGIPGALLSAEVDGLPVPGIPISNSPTMIAAAELVDRTLVQRSSAGVQALAAAEKADALFAAALVDAGATARAIADLGTDQVTIVVSRADHPEDAACAGYLEALLAGRRPDLPRLLAPLLASPRYAFLTAGEQPGFPASDVRLSLEADRFDFPMEVVTDRDGLLRVTRSPGASAST